MAQTKTYAANAVSVIFGSTILTGFVDGSFVTCEQEVDAFQKRVGAQGDVTRVRVGNTSGRVTIRLKQVADANAVLSAIHELDRLLNNGILPLTVRDASGTSVFSAAEAWITKSSNAEFATDESGREWIFDCAELIMNHGGNN